MKELSHYINQSKSIDPSSKDVSIRISILGSFTVNGLSETMQAMCNEDGIGCFSYVGPYNQYNQEILDSSSKLYQFKPDLTFLILDSRSILQDFFYDPYSSTGEERKNFAEKQAIQTTNLVKAFLKNSSSKMVVSNISKPSYSPWSICETKTKFGFHDMIDYFNGKLRENLRGESSAFVFDMDSFVKRYGEDNVFNYRQFFSGDIKIALDHIPKLSNQLMGFVRPVLGKIRKCIVVDLDNTLWGGVVGEDGFDGIKLGKTSPGNAYVEFQRYLLALNKRGIILAINSKNNPNDAMQVIRDHPQMILRENDFGCTKINWNDKVSNIKEIARELNIGLDSLVFVDDDPTNREMMKKYLPQVLTIDLPTDPSMYCQTIQDVNELNVLKITTEDINRASMYTEQKKRKELEGSMENLEDFLNELDIKVTVNDADSFSVSRISQLTLKTNQFNLTTKRYQEEDIQEKSNSDNYWVGCAKVEDKFGDSGITGAFIVEKEKDSKEWSIDTFLLSCRVMGKKIEDAVICHILERAKNEGISAVKAKYVQTEKNMPCSDFLKDYGFTKKNDGDEWVFDLKKKTKMPRHISLNNVKETL